MINNFAPVLITTLNRINHLRRCVNSLSKCTGADKTDVYIALDYPFNDSHWDGYNKIKQFFNEINGFKSINLIERDVNFGAIKNIESARDIVFKNYDRIILSEDDNEFSQNFLVYMNDGLSKFEGNPNVVAICGYNYPVDIPKDYGSNYYYFKAFSAWGFAEWRSKPPISHINHNKLSSLLNDKSYIKNSVESYQYANLEYVLRSFRQHKDPFGDGALTINMIKNNSYCIFPVDSKVRNWGHDGSGIHCRVQRKNTFASQYIDKNNDFTYSENVPLTNKKITKELKRYFGLGYKSIIKFLYLYFIYFIHEIAYAMWRREK